MFETFKIQNSDLYQAILKFKEEYEKAGSLRIFAKKDANVKEFLYKYDSEKIDIFNFYILIFFSEMDEEKLFEDIDVAVNQLKE